MEYMTLPSRAANWTVEQMENSIDAAEKFEADAGKIDATFQERADEGRQAIRTAVVALRAMLLAAKNRQENEAALEPPKPAPVAEAPAQRDFLQSEPDPEAVARMEMTVTDDYEKARDEALSDLRIAAGVSAVQAKQILGCIKRGEVRHVFFEPAETNEVAA